MKKNNHYCDLCKEQKKEKTIDYVVVTAEETGESDRVGNYVKTVQSYNNVKNVDVSICKECLVKQINLKTKNGIRFLIIATIVVLIFFIWMIIGEADSGFLTFIGIINMFFLIATLLFWLVMKQAVMIIENDMIKWKGYYAFNWFIPFFKQTALLKVNSEYDTSLQGQIWNTRPLGDMIPKQWNYIMAFTEEQWENIKEASKRI